nr:MAG TPA: KilAC domain protein [Caudoviricetes sp.]
MSENTKSLKKTEGLVSAFSEEKKENITSLELVEQINLFRKQELKNSMLKHSDFLKVVRDEFEGELQEGKIPSLFKIRELPNGGSKQDLYYLLTFNQAKQVLMRESKFVRKHIILYIERLENALKESQVIKLPQTYVEALEALLISEKEKLKLQEENRSMLPKAAFYDAVTGSESLVDMNQVAKTLNVKGLGRNNLFKFLREQNVLMENNQPYQQYMDAGYFKLIEVKWTDPKSEMINVSTKTMIFQRGVDFIDKLVKQKFNKTNNK